MKPTLKPGWKMTESQHRRYWGELSHVFRYLGVSGSKDCDEVRKRIHVQAFGEPISAKEIDRLGMFDAFIATCAAITKPTDLGTQMDQATMGRTRLKKAIGLLADDAYWQRIAFDRFHTTDLEILSDEQLTQLRNTLRCRSRVPAARRKQSSRVDETSISLRELAPANEHPF